MCWLVKVEIRSAGRRLTKDLLLAAVPTISQDKLEDFGEN